MAQEKYVGIDLGTSTSGLAYVKADGSPEIVPNIDGERLTPSIVYFDRYDGVKLVGSAARDGGDPERTVHNIKKHMDDPSFFIEMDGQKWTPTEITALILAKLKQDCSNIIGEIKDVVITVPANFNELARNATATACRLAGLNAVRLVNEPTAAALYYAQTRDISGKVMVYDLGGGTLDITILEIAGDEINILLSEGARHLGGSNFDEVLIEILAQEYQKLNGADLFQLLLLGICFLTLPAYPFPRPGVGGGQFHREAFLDEIDLLPNSRREFFDRQPPHGLTEIQRAANWWFNNALCFGGSSKKSYGYARKSGGASSASRINRMEAVYILSERLDKVNIENLDWRDCLARYDAAGTFFFMDPPYVTGDAKIYSPWGGGAIQELRDAIDSLKGSWLLTTCDSAECREIFSGLKIRKVSRKNGIENRKGKAKVEGQFHELIITPN